MKTFIVLYDKNDERVGETYPRRAKQLIRSGRASWLIEGQSMRIDTDIDLYPPVEEDLVPMTETIYTNNGTIIEEPTSSPPEASMDLLRYIAKRNVSEKRSFFRHIAAYILAWPLLYAIIFRFTRAQSDIQTEPELATLVIHEFGSVPRNSPNVFVLPQETQLWSNIACSTSNIASNEVFMNFDYITTVHANTGGQNVLWPFVFGVLVAWGVWIVVRGVKILRRYLHNRALRTPRLDPVEREIERLISIPN